MDDAPLERHWLLRRAFTNLSLWSEVLYLAKKLAADPRASNFHTILAGLSSNTAFKTDYHALVATVELAMTFNAPITYQAWIRGYGAKFVQFKRKHTWAKPAFTPSDAVKNANQHLAQDFFHWTVDRFLTVQEMQDDCERHELPQARTSPICIVSAAYVG
jgi:hypothetical protein